MNTLLVSFGYHFYIKRIQTKNTLKGVYRFSAPRG